MRHKLLLLPLILLIPLFLIIWNIFGLPAYLPHEKIVISVPYDFKDPPQGLIPMGETLYHPKPEVPNGHPGIDFGWNSGENHRVLSSSDGKVKSIRQGASDPGKWDVEVKSGAYLLRYKEMEGYNTDLKKGSTVAKGDLIGYVGRYCEETGNFPHCWFNLHWELASVSLLLDRWCPLSYFDPKSKSSIETLWLQVPTTDKVKSRFPEICSGDYKGKEE